ncbi:MAG: AAA family ATPase [Bacteroidota bacterium]
MHALVLGKFMPLHRGHLALIDFALEHCDRLTVLLCVEATEPISGEDRERWLRSTYANHPKISLQRFDFLDADLPATSESSRQISALWAAQLQELVPTAQRIIGSEAYVQYVAEYWGIDYRIFDVNRQQVKISATEIRAKPYQHRAFLAPAAQPDFVQRIVLHGTESTGKSTLATHLADRYGTSFVPEMARDIVAHTDTVVYEDLFLIADRQAAAIQAAVSEADGVLFIDTDIFTTLAYARYLFKRELPLRAEWLAAAKQQHCLFTRADAPYVQDGTRLQPGERKVLENFHWQARLESGVPTTEIVGREWAERTSFAEAVVAQVLLQEKHES